MPLDIELSLRISVNTPEEADKIYEAAFSGLAAELVRIGVLYGQIPYGAVVDGATTAPLSSAQRQERQRAANIELQRVDDIPASRKVEITEPEAPVRPKGLAGRKRFGRT